MPTYIYTSPEVSFYGPRHPTSFTTVLDTTLPFVGDTLWLYRHLGQSSKTRKDKSASSNLSAKHRIAIHLAKSSEESLESLASRYPDLENHLILAFKALK
jgi:hypothetical protein